MTAFTVKYIVCNTCGTDYQGEFGGPNTIMAIRLAARKDGWKILFERDLDYCPGCIPEHRKAGMA